MSLQLVNIAQSGMRAANKALEVHTLNVANQKTQGYSRQQAHLSTQTYGYGNAQRSGFGVSVTSVNRVTDEFTNQAKRLAASNLGALEMQKGHLKRLEDIFGKDNSSLSNGMDAFVSALSNASGKNVNDTLARQNVIAQANSMANLVNNLHKQLEKQQQEMNQDRSGLVAQINTQSSLIAELNQQIKIGQNLGNNTAALEDQRDRQIENLSMLVETRVIPQGDGSVQVSLTNGQVLVMGNTSSELLVNINGEVSVSYQSIVLPALDGTQLGGQLGGLFQAELSLQQKQDATDILVVDLVTEVNTILVDGFDINGAPGIGLFDYTNGKLTVLVTNPDDLAFSDNTETQNSGQLDLLLNAISTMQWNNSYNLITTNLSLESKEIYDRTNIALDIYVQSEAEWQSISGVDANDEAQQLMAYMKMVESNLKVISIANQLFDSTLAII